MLKITVPAGEYWDENLEEFVSVGKEVPLQLEHSLLSISKWESIWHVPFFSTEKNTEQAASYIKCMIVTQNVSEDVFYRLLADKNLINKINAYISDPMSATTFKKIESGKGGHGRNQFVTSELIYYWMIALNIPHEYEKWHINRLLNLIEICQRENDRAAGKGPKKSKAEQSREMRELNARRRAQLGTRG